MNETQNKDYRRLSTIRMIKDKFEPYFHEIKAEIGFDMEQILNTADNRILERILHQKEILVKGKTTITLPGVERYNLATELFSFRLLKVNEEGKRPWDAIKYPVKSVRTQKAGDGLVPIVIAAKKNVDFHFSMGSGDDAFSITLPAGSEDAEAWRLCHRGVTVTNAKGESYFIGPCRWNQYQIVARPLTNVRTRIWRCIKRSEHTPLSFRPFSQEQGKIFANSFAQFTVPRECEQAKEITDVLSRGGEVILVNEKGEKACVHFDCSENQLVEALPLKIAQEQDRSKAKVNKEKNEMNEQRSHHYKPAAPSQKKTTPRIAK